MSDSDFEQRLAAFCADRFGGGEDVSALRRLSGGANMESWAFDYGGRGMVLRRLPEGMAERGGDAASVAAISLATQAKLIELARERGVVAPEVLARLQESDGLGTGFVMARVEGETLPHKILDNRDFAQAEKRLCDQCAEQLAAIHVIPPDQAPDEIRTAGAETLLAEQERAYREIGGAIP
ncbi:MAG: phosphotransferase, partial [Parasphingopyxis sp.]